MMPKEAAPPEETLDPQDWDAMRLLGHRMVDDMMDYLQTIRDRPVWQPIPSEVRAHFNEPLPQQPQGPAQPYQEFLETVLPYNLGTSHPRFWGWVCGTGTPLAMLADLLASAINPNMGGAQPCPQRRRGTSPGKVKGEAGLSPGGKHRTRQRRLDGKPDLPCCRAEFLSGNRSSPRRSARVSPAYGLRLIRSP